MDEVVGGEEDEEEEEEEEEEEVLSVLVSLVSPLKAGALAGATLIWH